MKKILGLLCAACLLWHPVCDANDPWYELGKNIGSSIGNVGPATQSEKDFYYDESFDFARIKYLVISAPKIDRATPFISDPYIHKKYPALVKEKLQGKIKTMTIEEAMREYIQQSASLHPEYNSDQHLANMLSLTEKAGGVFVDAYILSYNYDAYGLANCFVIFSVHTPQNANNEILNYSDKRMNVPRSSKEGMSKRIAKSFADKFMEVYEKAWEIKPQD